MGRTPCCDKNNGLKKGPWTTEEDQKLIDYIQKHGYGNWRTLPKNAGLQRCGKSCRLRWTNYLRPDIKRGRFSFEEEEAIIQLHSMLGNKWSAIASRLPGRTDNEIKNYWNTHIRKRLMKMGIDPVTHSPRLDLLDFSSLLCSSLYGSSQYLNLQSLLNMQQQQQPLVNQELLKLASSLFSSQTQDNNNNYFDLCAQNGQHQNQVQQFVQFQDTMVPQCVSSLPINQSHLVEPNVNSYPSNFTDLSCQQNSQQPSDWQENNGFALSTSTNYYDIPQLSSYNNYYSSDQDQDQYLMYQTPNFHCNNGNQQYLSTTTPSSSPTPLNSNSTYINGSCNTEDEPESYDSTSNRLKFEIKNILEANEFM